MTVLLLERTASGGPGRPAVEHAHPQDGVLVLDGAFAQDRYLTEVCYPRGHGTYQRSATERAGVIVTDQEAWSVPAEELLLAPDTVYELTTTTRTTRRSPAGRTDVPLGDVGSPPVGATLYSVTAHTVSQAAPAGPFTCSTRDANGNNQDPSGQVFNVYDKSAAYTSILSAKS